jgi:autotransporter-associated beta strand protein
MSSLIYLEPFLSFFQGTIKRIITRNSICFKGVGIVVLATVLSLFHICPAYGQSYLNFWTIGYYNCYSTWNDTNHWSAGIPNAPGAYAVLQDPPYFVSNLDDWRMIVDIPATVGTLEIHANFVDLYGLYNSGSGALTFDSGSPSANALLKVTGSYNYAYTSQAVGTLQFRLQSNLDINTNTNTYFESYIPIVENVAGKQVTKTGAGTLKLYGANQYSGGTIVSAGMLRLANTAALGTGGLTINGGTLDLYGISPNPLPSLSGSSGLITDNSTASGTTLLTVGMSGGSTYAGGIKDGSAKKLAITKTGSGTLSLTGALAYTGTTTISGGVLQINSPYSTLGTQNLHTISGTGILGIGNGTSATSLTVDSINIGVLTLGKGSRLTIAPLAGGPLAGMESTSPVPEPATLVMLLTAGLVGLVFGIRRLRR